MRAWQFWRQSAAHILYVLLVEITVAAVTVVLALRSVPTLHELYLFLALAVAGSVQGAAGRRVEGLRRRVSDTPHVNLTSAWTFAGVLLMPAILNFVLVVVLYAQLNLSSADGSRPPPWRAIMNASIVVLTCYAARGVLSALGFDNPDDLGRHPSQGFLILVLGTASYLAVNLALITPSVWIRTGSLATVLGTADDNLLEVSTLCVGALAAAGMDRTIAFAFAVIPPMMMLHRGLLGLGTERSAIYDSKTGLLSAASWMWAANQSITRSVNGLTSIFMIDLDLFKRINDQHGHLVGDEVLLAVANCVQAQVRSNDITGRFGGEEFVALLPEATVTEVGHIAERIRLAVANLRIDVDEGRSTISDLSVSVGVAHHPQHGPTLDTVLKAADAALYAAKASGRNRVVHAMA